MKPQPYDLSQGAELNRLMRELEGYIQACEKEHHGTDFEGRMHALDALRQINSGDRPIVPVKMAHHGVITKVGKRRLMSGDHE